MLHSRAIECGCFLSSGGEPIVALQTASGCVARNVRRRTEVVIKSGAPVVALWPSGGGGGAPDAYKCATAAGVYAFQIPFDVPTDETVDVTKRSPLLAADSGWPFVDAAEFDGCLYALASRGGRLRVTTLRLTTVASTADRRALQPRRPSPALITIPGGGGDGEEGSAAASAGDARDRCRLGAFVQATSSDDDSTPLLPRYGCRTVPLPEALADAAALRYGEGSRTSHTAYVTTANGDLYTLPKGDGDDAWDTPRLLPLRLGEPVASVHGGRFGPDCGGEQFLLAIGELGTAVLLLPSLLSSERLPANGVHAAARAAELRGLLPAPVLGRSAVMLARQTLLPAQPVSTRSPVALPPMSLLLYHTDGADLYETRLCLDAGFAPAARLGMCGVAALHAPYEGASTVCVTFQNGTTTECDRLQPTSDLAHPECLSDLLRNIELAQERAGDLERRLLRLEGVAKQLNIFAHLRSGASHTSDLGIAFDARVVHRCGEWSQGRRTSISCRLFNTTSSLELDAGWTACFELRPTHAAAGDIATTMSRTLQLRQLSPGAERCAEFVVDDGDLTADAFPLTASCTLAYRRQLSPVELAARRRGDGSRRPDELAEVSDPIVLVAPLGSSCTFDLPAVAWQLGCGARGDDDDVDDAERHGGDGDMPDGVIELRLPPIELTEMLASEQQQPPAAGTTSAVGTSVGSGPAGLLHRLFPQLCAVSDVSFACRTPFSGYPLTVAADLAATQDGAAAVSLRLRSRDSFLLASFASATWRRIQNARGRTPSEASLPPDTRQLTEVVRSLNSVLIGGVASRSLHPDVICDIMTRVLQIRNLLQV